MLIHQSLTFLSEISWCSHRHEIEKAVLSIPSFEAYGRDIIHFTATIRDFLKKSKAAGMTKVLIDVQQNAGGILFWRLMHSKRVFRPQILFMILKLMMLLIRSRYWPLWRKTIACSSSGRCAGYYIYTTLGYSRIESIVLLFIVYQRVGRHRSMRTLAETTPRGEQLMNTI